MKDLDREREMIRAVAAKTAQKVVHPRAAEIDAAGEIPLDLIDTLGKQGFLALVLPEAYGGTHGDILTFCMVVEEIAKVSGSASLLILAQGIGVLPVMMAGSPSQQEQFFTRIAEENRLAAFTLGEPGFECHPSRIKTRAEKQGEDYLINGQKSFIVNGSMADIYTVFAVTHPSGGAKGISAFVVEKGTPGLRFGKNEDRLGMRGVATTDVLFENCRIPAQNRLGEEGEGWEIARKAMNVARVACGAQAVGISQGAFDVAIPYSQERTQFGKAIASFQGVRFMVSDMATQIEAARALVYKAIHRLVTQSDDGEELSAAAKVFASNTAMKVTTDAVQLLGGYGYMKDYPVERMMRDAKVTQIYEGANQVQQQVVARHLLKEE